MFARLFNLPRGTLAHSTHGRGIGRHDAGTGEERCRLHVTLATGIPRAVCERMNPGHRHPATVDVESFAKREAEGVLPVRRAGEMPRHLRDGRLRRRLPRAAGLIGSKTRCVAGLSAL